MAKKKKVTKEVVAEVLTPAPELVSVPVPAPEPAPAPVSYPALVIEPIPEPAPKKETPVETIVNWAQSNSPKWYDSMLAEARKKTTTMPKANKVLADQAIGYLEQNKTQLLALGVEGFKTFLGYFAGGERPKARDFYIRTMMPPKQIIAEMRKSTQALEQALKKQGEIEVQANMLITGIGVLALRILQAALLA